MARPILVTMAAMLLVGTSVGGQRTAALTCRGGYALRCTAASAKMAARPDRVRNRKPLHSQAVRDAARDRDGTHPTARRQERHHDHVFPPRARSPGGRCMDKLTKADFSN